MTNNDDRTKQKETYSYQYQNIRTDVKIEQTIKDNGEKDTYVTKTISIVRDSEPNT